ncbi:MAG: tripartite tricarboxylate transporter substrate binding protein [Acetobacteraceae bacterium]|nr:tripartite tricarboxylate transporter substrate binding protein [Acetobacteraceae bacterium]
MPHRRSLLLAASLAPLAAPRLARAQQATARWVPDRPILFISGYSPGGSTDIGARLIADRMAAAIGPEARIIVENRPGAAGTIATEWLKNRAPDGTTIMIQETGAGAAAPTATIGGTRYDPMRDFSHLGVISTPPGPLVFNNAFAPANLSTAQVIEKLRTAPPESITYASSGFGGVLHLRSEMFAQHLGTRFVHVPYRSGAQMLTAIMQGEAQFGIAALASANAFMREGKVRALAMIGDRRFSQFPDIPTMDEIGIPGFDNAGWFMLWGPAGIPRPIAETLNAALVSALRDPGVRERMIIAGHDPVQGENTLDGARAYLERELGVMRQMVDRTGIRLQP